MVQQVQSAISRMVARALQVAVHAVHGIRHVCAHPGGQHTEGKPSPVPSDAFASPTEACTIGTGVTGAAAAARVSFSVGRSPLSQHSFIFISDHSYYTRTAHPIPVVYFRYPDFQFISYHTHSIPLPLVTRLGTARFFSVGRRVPGPGAFHALAKFTRSPYSSIQRSPKWPDSIGTRSSPPSTLSIAIATQRRTEQRWQRRHIGPIPETSQIQERLRPIRSDLAASAPEVRTQIAAPSLTDSSDKAAARHRPVRDLGRPGHQSTCGGSD